MQQEPKDDHEASTPHATEETPEEATRRLIRDAEEYARGEEEGA